MWQVLNGLDSEPAEGGGREGGGSGSGGRQSQLFVAQLFISFNWRPMRKQFVGPAQCAGRGSSGGSRQHVAGGMWHVACSHEGQQQLLDGRRLVQSLRLARCFFGLSLLLPHVAGYMWHATLHCSFSQKFLALTRS